MMFRIVGPPRPVTFHRVTEYVGVQERAASVMAAVDRTLNRAALAEIDAVLARCPAVEFRSASTTSDAIGVDQTGRTIRLIVVPYEEPTQVAFRGQAWSEVFSRGAFDDLGGRTVRVNRDHDRTRTVGRVVRFDARDPRGLVAELRISQTTLGDEALALAADDCLSASIGFSVPAGGEQLDHRARVRRITRAKIDHVALTSDPAYLGASVLAVG